MAASKAATALKTQALVKKVQPERYNGNVIDPEIWATLTAADKMATLVGIINQQQRRIEDLQHQVHVLDRKGRHARP